MTASAFHDIGKMGIDEKILNKSGQLTEEEYIVMKSHTLIGASMLARLDHYRDEELARTAYQICRWHHERYDGGDVEAGLAIAELISGMKKPTVSLVLGGGHSIGVPLAVAPMVTMIAPSASMTIHPVRTSGTIIAAPQTYQYFERLQERIVRFVTKHSNITRERFLALMMDTQDLASDVGSVLYGEEAVACGLVGRLGGLSDALEALYGLIEEKKKKNE